MIAFINNILSRLSLGFYIPDINIIDILEIIILTYLIYHLIIWIMSTKAWTLIKGIAVIGVFILIASILQMQTILFIVKNCVSVLAVAGIVVFQPELRRALEKLGEKSFIPSVVSFETGREMMKFTDDSREGMIAAAFAMGKVKTGALIVIEQMIHLTEYEETGIELDCLISRQVLINIFEHNTPLHDGAVIVRGDRIASATCYLPLSDNMNLSKDLGTRHRAGVGISEVSDAFVIIVSEETGAVSVAKGGKLYRNIGQKQLRSMLSEIQDDVNVKKNLKISDYFRRIAKHEEKNKA